MPDQIHSLPTLDVSQLPANVRAGTPEQQKVYQAALEFERTFVAAMMKQMNAATDALASGGSDDDPQIGGAGTSAYKDMVQDQMADAVLKGGGLGIASMLYEQITEGDAAAPLEGGAS